MLIFIIYNIKITIIKNKYVKKLKNKIIKNKMGLWSRKNNKRFWKGK